MKQTVKDALTSLQIIKLRLSKGEDYYKLKEESNKYFDIINKESEKIAKKYNKKPQKLTFINYMR